MTLPGIEELAVPGAFLVTPGKHRDGRGVFYESVRTDELGRVTGRPFQPRQINYSVSRRGTLRGLHGVSVPPGQAKYVTCVRGAVRDIIVDLRLGSPRFGRHSVNVLEADSGCSVLVPEGAGHGFLALTDDACICYVVSTPHVPGTQFAVNALDPELALPWELDDAPLLSENDAAAPTLAQAAEQGLLAR